MKTKHIGSFAQRTDPKIPFLIFFLCGVANGINVYVGLGLKFCFVSKIDVGRVEWSGVEWSRVETVTPIFLFFGFLFLFYFLETR